MAEPEIGVLLPHFGDHASVGRIVGHAPNLERLGYQSVWVRDNLAYTPHPFEPSGRTFVDGFVTLAAVAAVTARLGLGTGVTIPFRAPAVTAQLVGSLCWLAPGRVRLGMGFGSPRPAFAAAGVPFRERFVRCEETLSLLRRLGQPGNAASGDPAGGWRGEARTHDLAPVPSIDPVPPADLPIWFGGWSDRSLATAARWCDGLLLARVDLATIARVRARASELADQGGRPLRIGSVVVVLPGTSYRHALRGVDQARLLDELGAVNKREYADLREARGAVLAGTPDDIGEGLTALAEAGTELLVIDLRLALDRFEEWTTALGESLLGRSRPALTPASTAAASRRTPQAHDPSASQGKAEG